MSQSSEKGWMALRLTVRLPEGTDELEAHPSLMSLFDVCLRVSPGGFATEGPDAPPGDLAPPPKGHLRVLLYVQEDDLGSAREALEREMALFAAATLDIQPLSPDWRERWKRWFKAFTVSPELGVRPPWEPLPEGLAADGLCIEIEPGMAFGTGQHATTHLCLRMLDKLLLTEPTPGKLLDVGCGTGILAIAASMRGVSEVLGVDIDEAAVRCARDNAKSNQLTNACAFETTPLHEVHGRYPLVVANIIAPVLHALSEELVEHVTPRGRLLLSGALTTQSDALRVEMEALGMSMLKHETHGEWSALLMERLT